MDSATKDRLVRILENRLDQLYDQAEHYKATTFELTRERKNVKNSLEWLKMKIQDENRDFTRESLAGCIESILDLFKDYDAPLPVKNQTGAGNALSTPASVSTGSGDNSSLEGK